MEKPLHVFCCYARADQSYLFELNKRLIPLQRDGLIIVHADINISPGEDWEQKIHHYLNTAHVILLLISSDFIASEYCYSNEMMRSLERHNAGDARVIPIILRPVDLRHVPFRKIQFLPTDAKPVTRWADQDDAFLDVANGIRDAIEKLLSPSHGEILHVQQEPASPGRTPLDEQKQPMNIPLIKPMLQERAIPDSVAQKFNLSPAVVPTQINEMKPNPEPQKPALEQYIKQHAQQQTASHSSSIWSWFKRIQLMADLTKPKEDKRHCPRCYEEFSLGACDIVATFPPHTVGETLYTAQKNHLRMGTKPQPITEELLKRMAVRRCPNCDYFLPSNIDTVPIITIAIVGEVSSGKSHYIAALINQLRNERVASEQEHFRVLCMTPTVEEIYIQELLEPLFEENKALLTTRPLSSGELIDPLIYEISFRHLKNKYSSRTVNIAIYETSGVEYTTQQKMMEFARHVVNANGLIYLADPLSMPAIANRLPKHIRKSMRKWHKPSDTLNRIIFLINRYASSSQDRLRDLPLAVAITKADLLAYLTTNEEQWKCICSRKHNDGLNLRDVEQIDSEVRNVIEEFGDVPLLQAAAAFRNAHFFATSATGYPPDESGLFPAVEPNRCLDPLLWIFYKLGIISTK